MRNTNTKDVFVGWWLLSPTWLCVYRVKYNVVGLGGGFLTQPGSVLFVPTAPLISVVDLRARWGHGDPLC